MKRRPHLQRSTMMPRFFFDVQNGHASHDDVGIECRDLAAAIKEANRSLPAIAGEAIPNGPDQQDFFIVVRDEHGKDVYSAALSFTARKL
jgi:hypothetical protein